MLFQPSKNQCRKYSDIYSCNSGCIKSSLFSFFSFSFFLGAQKSLSWDFYLKIRDLFIFYFYLTAFSTVLGAGSRGGGVGVGREQTITPNHNQLGDYESLCPGHIFHIRYCPEI